MPVGTSRIVAVVLRYSPVCGSTLSASCGAVGLGPGPRKVRLRLAAAAFSFQDLFPPPLLFLRRRVVKLCQFDDVARICIQEEKYLPVEIEIACIETTFQGTLPSVYRVRRGARRCSDYETTASNTRSGLVMYFTNSWQTSPMRRTSTSLV